MNQPRITAKSRIAVHVQGFFPALLECTKELNDGSFIFECPVSSSFRGDRGMTSQLSLGHTLLVQVRFFRDGRVEATSVNLNRVMKRWKVLNYVVLNEGTEAEMYEVLKRSVSSRCYAEPNSVVVVKFAGKPALGLRYSHTIENKVERRWSNDKPEELEQQRLMSVRHLFTDGESQVYVYANRAYVFTSNDLHIEDIAFLPVGATRGQVAELCAKFDAGNYEPPVPRDYAKAYLYHDAGGRIRVLLDVKLKQVKPGNRFRHYRIFIYSAKQVLHAFKDKEEAYRAIDQYFREGFKRLQTQSVTFNNGGWKYEEKKQHRTKDGHHTLTLQRGFSPAVRLA